MPTFTTKNPFLMAMFFLHVGFDRIEKEIREYDELRGSVDEVEVVFFKEVPGKCPVLLKEDETYFPAVKYFELEDKQEHRTWTHRRLKVILA